MIFLTLFVSVFAYLYNQWQRYEPTPVPIDGAAGVAAYVFALAVTVAT